MGAKNPVAAIVRDPEYEAAFSLDALSLSPLEFRASAPQELVASPTPQRSLPTYDILGFLEEHAPLEAWERDVLHVIREEAYYFAPQRMTRIMNEGWASFWHSRLLTGGILDAAEILDFADCHSAATLSVPGQLNPYKLGIELYRHAEAIGQDIFQLRRVHNDVSLVHKLVDEEFAERFLRSIGPQVLPARREGKGNAPRPATWEELKSWAP